MLLTKPTRRYRPLRGGRQLTLRGLILSLSLALVPIQAPAQADDQTLADIRQELTVLYVELQRLKRELSTTTAPSVPLGGGSPLERLDAIEREMERLTAKTERLEFRLNSVVKDGTNRIGDLDFRLCEIDPKCDIAKLEQTGILGGKVGAGLPPTPQRQALPNQASPRAAPKWPSLSRPISTAPKRHWTQVSSPMLPPAFRTFSTAIRADS
jgi:hypothetical protein